MTIHDIKKGQKFRKISTGETWEALSTRPSIDMVVLVPVNRPSTNGCVFLDHLCNTDFWREEKSRQITGPEKTTRIGQGYESMANDAS